MRSCTRDPSLLDAASHHFNCRDELRTFYHRVCCGCVIGHLGMVSCFCRPIFIACQIWWTCGGAGCDGTVVVFLSITPQMEPVLT